MDKRYLALTIVYLVIIYILSDQSTLPMPNVFFRQDLIFHAMEYTVLFYLIFMLFKKTRIWVPFFLTWGYGILDEIHQYFVPLRQMSLLDMMADAAGPLILILIISLYRNRKNSLCA